MKKSICSLLTVLVLSLAPSFTGCGGQSTEAVAPETFAPKPPAENLDEGGTAIVAPAESDG